MRMLLDLYKQIRGVAGSNQIDGKLNNVVMLNIGGSATTNCVALDRPDTIGGRPESSPRRPELVHKGIGLGKPRAVTVGHQKTVQ